MVLVAFAGRGFLLFAIEGLVCIVMAIPLALPLALIGGLAGHAAQPARWRGGARAVLCAAFLAFPAMIGVERGGGGEAPLLEVKSVIEVNAPPARVWRHVVTFSELAPPTEWQSLMAGPWIIRRWNTCAHSPSNASWRRARHPAR